MALTRKMLKAMGIEDEKIDQIIEAHTETVDALKNERDKYREDAEKLPDVQKKLDAAQKANSGDESFEVKYNSLKKEFEEYKGEVTAKETKGAKETALRNVLKKLGVADKSIPWVIKGTNLDELELDKNGSLKNVDKVEEKYRDECSSLIVTESERATKPETPPTGSKTPMSKDEIMKIKDTSERQAAIAENLDLFNS